MSFAKLRDRWRSMISRKRAPTTPKVVGWESLPLLPLKRILEYLSLEDAVAATSVCRNWRTGLWFYEAPTQSLMLRIEETERNMFLARMFRKYVKELYIYMDAEDENWDKFFDIVLPEFFDTVDLQAVTFAGQSYFEHDYTLPPAKLKRVVVESFLFRHIQTLKRIIIVGCEMDMVKDADLHTHEKVKQFSTMLTFNSVYNEADRILTRCNTAHMAYSNTRLVIIDYEQASQEALATLCGLPKLCVLTLVVTEMTTVKQRIKWGRLPLALPVCITLVGVPERRLNYFIEEILFNVVLLVSVKVLFSGTFYFPLITHLVQHHKNNLTELVWIDGPHVSENPKDRFILSKPLEADLCDINPLILMCWQCTKLKRLSIHGYWIWQYDVLGFLRLRASLDTIELSSVYIDQDRFACDSKHHVAVRLMKQDKPEPPTEDFKKQVSVFSACEWIDYFPWIDPASEQSRDFERCGPCVLTELDAPLPCLFNI